MGKAEIWKPESEERIDWNHPAVTLTGTAPGYLVQELYGYADGSWRKWLRRNEFLVTRQMNRPWITLALLSRVVTDGEENTGEGD